VRKQLEELLLFRFFFHSNFPWPRTTYLYNGQVAGYHFSSALHATTLYASSIIVWVVPPLHNPCDLLDSTTSLYNALDVRVGKNYRWMVPRILVIVSHPALVQAVGCCSFVSFCTTISY